MKKIVSLLFVFVVLSLTALSALAQAPVSGANDMLSNYALRKLNSEQAVVAVSVVAVEDQFDSEIATVVVTETKSFTETGRLVTSTLRLTEVGPQLSNAAQLAPAGLAITMPKTVEEAANLFGVDSAIVTSVVSADTPDTIYGWVIRPVTNTRVTLVEGLCLDHSYSSSLLLSMPHWTVLMDKDWARTQVSEGGFFMVADSQATVYFAECWQEGGELISYDSDWMSTLP